MGSSGKIREREGETEEGWLEIKEGTNMKKKKDKSGITGFGNKLNKESKRREEEAEEDEGLRKRTEGKRKGETEEGWQERMKGIKRQIGEE